MRDSFGKNCECFPLLLWVECSHFRQRSVTSIYIPMIEVESRVHWICGWGSGFIACSGNSAPHQKAQEYKFRFSWVQQQKKTMCGWMVCTK